MRLALVIRELERLALLGWQLRERGAQTVAFDRIADLELFNRLRFGRQSFREAKPPSLRPLPRDCFVAHAHQQEAANGTARTRIRARRTPDARERVVYGV